MEPEDLTGASTDTDPPPVGAVAHRRDYDHLTELLVNAERQLAAIPDLNLRIADLEYELAQARREVAAARREAWELDQMLMYGRRALRYARPIIEPLRMARKRLRS